MFLLGLCYILLFSSLFEDFTNLKVNNKWLNLKLTLSGKLSKEVRPGVPFFVVLKRRMMSWSVAATTKYSCFRRSSFPSKNYSVQRPRRLGFSTIDIFWGTTDHQCVEQTDIMRLMWKRWSCDCHFIEHPSVSPQSLFCILLHRNINMCFIRNIQLTLSLG